MSADERVREIRARLEAATPGPWGVYNGTDVFGPHGGDSGDGAKADDNDGWQVADCAVGLTSYAGDFVPLGHAVRIANAHLIAHAPADLRWLLDRVERLERENAHTECIAHLNGIEAGVRLFAWWKDGVQYVGSTGTTLADALADVEAEKAAALRALDTEPEGNER